MAKSINTMPIVINTRRSAQNAVISRLLTCFVNEQLVDAYITEPPNGINGKSDQLDVLSWCQVTKLRISSPTDSPIQSFWIGLKGTPLTLVSHGKVKVTFIDPEDFSLPVFSVTPEADTSEVNDPSILMNTLAEWNNLDRRIVSNLNDELASSVEHLDHAYRNRKNPPNLGDPGIIWEQSIIEGHPIHPMCKTRYAMPPIQQISVREMNFDTPLIHFFAVPRSKMIISGNYEKLIEPFLQNLKLDLETETIIPVHEIQIPNVVEKFPFARDLGFSESALAQLSLRTVLIPKVPGVTFKLPVGIIITDIQRLIEPHTAQYSPSFNHIPEAIVEDKENLIIVNELGSIVSNDPNPAVAEHLSCMIREDPDAICNNRGEIAIVCVALTQKESSNGEYTVTRALTLDTTDKRIQFFQKYSKSYLKAFVTPFYKYGFAFEAHQQNVLARFKKQVDGHYEFIGFAVRDIGGAKIYGKQFTGMTGIDLKCIPCETTDNVEYVNRFAFHIMIQMHLHFIIRALDLHYSGVGWGILRRELNALLPQDCPIRKIWLDTDTVDYNGFINVKLLNITRGSHISGRRYFSKIPNLIIHPPKENYNFLNGNASM